MTASSDRGGRGAAGYDFLSGGGETGALMRALDWSRTPLGPVATWPQSLRTSVSTCLSCAFPILVWWGPALVMLYNDEYRQILGAVKHPKAMGQRGAACWPEIWDVIGPMLRQVTESGEAIRARDLLLLLERNGYPEECYFSFSYSPIRDETGGVGGVFTPVIETTAKVIGERRLRTLKDLAARRATAGGAAEACRIAAETLSANAHDIPFALLYLLEGEEGARQARLACTAGIAAGTPASPASIALDAGASAAPAAWPLAAVIAANAAVEVDRLATRFDPAALPGGAWGAPPSHAVVLPVTLPGQPRIAAFLVAAVSPRKALDAEYRSFLDLVADQVAAGIAEAAAHEEERRRAAALAELDRAKTAFFSNVSHEFRTPLTLMIGPLEELLAAPERRIPPAERERLAVAHRNSLRLLKLVNSLLDFSRIEAGRLQASYEPTDLAAYTAELASTFRSAIERAGMRFIVDCPPLPEPVQVDRDMWEKIVLNLLSNAFKFTFAGEIAIALRRAGGKRVALVVRDTGTGIPADELPRLFERFHRIAGAAGRTYEGSGIGLALVQELVKLHGGTVAVESTPGRGSAFTIALPLGSAHLPAERAGDAHPRVPTTTRAAAYVDEALRSLPDEAAEVGDGARLDASRLARLEPRAASGADGERARIILADDNADMRRYVRRLLAAEYAVEALADGAAALAAIRRRRPDLVLTDVMMPRLDGFGLLRAIREDAELRDLPVVMLSARAGEDSKVEGLEAGADDYLAKPFTAAELLARVAATLGMARVRRQAAAALHDSRERLDTIINQAAVGIAQTDPSGRFILVNGRFCDILGRPREDVLGRSMQELTHPDDLPANVAAFTRLLETGEPFVIEKRYVRPDGAAVWVNNHVSLTRDRDGRPQYVVAVVQDVTERRRAEAASRESEARFAAVFSQAAAGLSVTDLDGRFQLVNDRYCAIVGRRREELLSGLRLHDITHPADLADNLARFARLIETGTPFDMEKRYLRPDGSAVWVNNNVSLVRDAAGRVRGALAATVDITERRRATDALHRLNETLEQRVELRTRELQAEIDERKRAEAALVQAQKIEAVGQLTSGVAHDFNNLLTAILGNLELAEMRLSDEAVRKQVQAAARAAQRGARLTAQLLAFSRKQHLAPLAVDLRHLITNMGEMFDRTLGGVLQVRTAFADDLWPVLVDPNQIELAVLNLALNARDAMPEGGTLLIEARNITRRERPGDKPPDLPRGEFVLVSMIDTGIGMDEATLAHAFEPFFTTKPVGRGSGLGLSMVYGVAQQSGGSVRLQSKPGQGTRVDLYLPRGSAAAAALSADGAAPSLPSGGRARVLVVDDQDDVRDVTVAHLETLGYRVAQAVSGGAAIALLDEGEPVDLMLIDYAMPGMSGAELARIAAAKRPGLPLVFVTGYADAAVLGDSVQNSQVLKKPFRLSELGAAVERALRGAVQRAPPARIVRLARDKRER